MIIGMFIVGSIAPLTFVPVLPEAID